MPPSRAGRGAVGAAYGITPEPRGGSRRDDPASQGSGSLDKRNPVAGLNDDERMLLGEGLCALRRERGAAWNGACDAAEAQGKRRPSLRAYGIEEIRRLARRLGVRATHWTEE